ncbi:hypothetical protein GW17_00035100 [Ensete ventricosum]|nr:hypothetical protein GW17_00035100 [Ensete ventricosum]
MRLRTHQECVGSSPRVSGVYQDGAREFAKRRSRLTRRLSGVAEKLVESRDVQTKRWDLVGSSLRDSPKESGSSLGMRREIAGKKTGGLVARLPEAAEVYRNYNQRIGQSQVQALDRSEEDAIGNSPRVRRELAEGIRSLSEWRKGVRWKKTETCQKIIGG